MCNGQGDRQKALKLFSEANEVYQQVGDLSLGNWIMEEVAWEIWDHGNLRQAYQLVKSHLEQHRKLRARYNIVLGLGMVLNMAILLGEFDAARQYVDELLGIRALLTRKEERWGIFDDGKLDFTIGHFAEARRKFEHALTICQEVNDSVAIAHCQTYLGMIHVVENRPSEGLALLEQSREIYGKANLPYDGTVLLNLLFLGQACCAGKAYERALSPLCEALRRVSHTGQLPAIPGLLEALAETAAGMGALRRAAVLLGAAHQQREKMGLPIQPVFQPAYDMTLQSVSQGMGAEGFHQALSEGEALTVKESVSFALEAQPA